MRYFTNCNVYLSGVAMLYLCVALIGCGDDTIHKTKLTQEEALPFFSEPLPVSASNIYCYLKAEGWQGLTRFARFDVEQADLHSAVEAFIAHNNTGYGRDLTFERREISQIPEEQLGAPRRLSRDAGLDWWNPENIVKGYYRGQIESYAIRLWIDEENSRIYLYQSD